MRRFIGNVDLTNHSCSFNPDTLHHMKVIRLNIGEDIEVVSNGRAYLYKVISPYPLKLKWLLDKEVTSRELDFTHVLLCPLLKKDNFEFVLQKSVELGVGEIVPFISSRVIKRVSYEEFEDKRERFLKIIQEAVEQSNRDLVPILDPLYTYQKALLVPGDIKLFAYEDEAIKGQLIPSFQGVKGKRVISLFGPEGGFSYDEAKKAVDQGFTPISLGKRILRAETAAIYLMSVVDYLGER